MPLSSSLWATTRLTMMTLLLLLACHPFLPARRQPPAGPTITGQPGHADGDDGMYAATATGVKWTGHITARQSLDVAYASHCCRIQSCLQPSFEPYLQPNISSLFTGWVKKVNHNILHITSSNTGRFSKFFHSHFPQEICNKAIIKYHTSPQTRRYTTLWNDVIYFTD